MRMLDGVRRKLVEALGGSILGDRGSVTSDEDIGFRPISERGGNRKTRDLNLPSHKDSIDASLFAYHSNPVGEFLVDMPVALVVGQEIGYSISINADDAGISPQEAKKLTETIRKVLDKFWYHPAHNISEKAPEYARTYLVTAHLVLPVSAVNEVDGTPQFDLIDAGQITGVVPKGRSAMVPGLVKFGTTDPGGKEQGMLVLQLNTDGLLVPEDPQTFRSDGGGAFPEGMDPINGLKIVCEGLYFRRNKLLNSMRGVPYLLPVADWLDGLDQFMWTTLDRAKLRNAIVWHLKLSGITDEAKIAEEVQKVLGVIGRPGSVYATNDSADIQAIGSGLAADAGVEIGRWMLTHILGSKGLPESWYSQGGNANRATAGEQTDVAYKAMQVLQTTFRNIFRTMLWVAYDSLQAKQPGAFPKRTTSPWMMLEPLMPVVQERDMSRLAAACSQLVAGLGQGVQDRFISERTSRKTFLDVLGQVTGGAYELDVEEAQIQTEEEARQARDAQAAADAARLVLDRNLKADHPSQQPSSPKKKNGKAAQA